MLTISDDDTASTRIELSLNPTRVTEQGGQQTVTVTAMLNAGSRVSDTLVNVTVAGDTATVGDDFGAVGNFSITIPANQPSGQNTFSLTPVNDVIAEGDETLQVSGTSPLPVDGVMLTISDDDTASTRIELSLNPTRVTEPAASRTVTVTAMLNAGSRVSDPETRPPHDTIHGLNPSHRAGRPADRHGHDQRCDTASTSLNPTRATEQGGQQTVTVTAMLNAGSRVSDTLVNVTVAGDTATVGDDFGAVGNFSISIPANQPSGQNTFSLTPVNDVIAEGDETLQVSGTSPLPVDPGHAHPQR